MNRTKLSLLVFVGALLCTPLLAQGQTNQDAPKWTGQLSAGFTSTRGNSQNDNFTASASAERSTDKDRITAGADYANSRQKQPKTATEDWWRLLGQYDYFFQPKWFAFANARYETDRIAQLDYRAVIGAGVGYQVIKSEPTNFSVEAGLASINESFRNTTPKSNEVALQAGYKFDHQIIDTVKFLHDLTYYPTIDDVSDSYVTTSAELRASFTANMFSSAKVLLSRDTSPATGQGNSEIKYILSVGWSF